MLPKNDYLFIIIIIKSIIIYSFFKIQFLSDSS